MLFHSSLVAYVGLVDDCGLGIFLSILGHFGSFGSYLCHLRAVHSEGEGRSVKDSHSEGRSVRQGRENSSFLL